MALDAIGEAGRALDLFGWVQFLRHDDGAYWCGMNFEGGRYDSVGEYFTADHPTWNSAAVVLAAHALGDDGPTAGLFRGEALPAGLSRDELLQAGVRSRRGAATTAPAATTEPTAPPAPPVRWTRECRTGHPRPSRSVDASRSPGRAAK